MLGLLALLVALEGYRNGTRWAWRMMWVPVAAFAALTGIFRLLTGESYALGFGVLSFAVITLVGLLLARKGLAGRTLYNTYPAPYAYLYGSGCRWSDRLGYIDPDIFTEGWTPIRPWAC